jgi:hypothetical protein
MGLFVVTTIDAPAYSALAGAWVFVHRRAGNSSPRIGGRDKVNDVVFIAEAMCRKDARIGNLVVCVLGHMTRKCFKK